MDPLSYGNFSAPRKEEDFPTFNFQPDGFIGSKNRQVERQVESQVGKNRQLRPT